VHADEHVLGALELAAHERDVVLGGENLPEGKRGEFSISGRKTYGRNALDQLLGPASVLDQVGDGHHLQAVPPAVRNEVGDARHRSVVVHDLAQHAGGIQPGQAREVD
jgi:hypothetical protein